MSGSLREVLHRHGPGNHQRARDCAGTHGKSRRPEDRSIRVSAAPAAATTTSPAAATPAAATAAAIAAAAAAVAAAAAPRPAAALIAAVVTGALGTLGAVMVACVGGARAPLGARPQSAVELNDRPAIARPPPRRAGPIAGRRRPVAGRLAVGARPTAVLVLLPGAVLAAVDVAVPPG